MKPFPIYLDHLFILTEPGAPVAEKITEIGLVEGNANTHPGQGSANRRFFLENFTIELLYISNEDEARQGLGRDLRLLDRYQSQKACPYGIVSRVTEPGTAPEFNSWKYYPDYFNGDLCFYVGVNSDCLSEPLCICMPPELPLKNKIPEQYANKGWRLSSVEIAVPVEKPSEELACFAAMESVKIRFGQPHQMTLCLNHGENRKSLDLNPVLPLVIQW